MNDEYKDITVLDTPIETDWAEWLENHPDCDSIRERERDGDLVRILAFSNSEEGNTELEQYRDRFLPGYIIMTGLSRYAITGII